jgi:asparagine synthase (glutamine-hydrolysing)
MCGIFGIIRSTPIDGSDQSLLHRLSSALIHRGPDGEGLEVSRHVAIGMRRLAIIDLAGGWQPLWNEQRDVCLVANGEIYNHVELRADLVTRGHRFQTGSDCETIIHLYEEYGADCVRHLRGMFAFALHDQRAGRVLIARDRGGEKPLYVAGDNQRIVFSSEMRSLVGAGAVPFEIDPAAVNLYLHYGFVPEPWAAVKGVRKLGAAHLMEISLDPWSVCERRWWAMEDAPPIDANPAKTIRGMLDEISELIVRADVPVGVALSGGVDSSLVAMMAKRRLDDRLTAFSIGYEGGAWQDETGLAQEFADAVGIRLEITHLRPEEVVQGFADICLWRDDPTADLSGSSYYAVMHAARQVGVPVMLMGHGGDELFWGYKWMRDTARRCETRSAMQRGEAGIGSYLTLDRPPVSWTGLINWARDGGGVVRGWRHWMEDRTVDRNQIPPWDPHGLWKRADVFGETMLACWEEASKVDPSAIFRSPAFWPRSDIAITKLVNETYNCVNGIAQGDRLSMATSVESRLPLVDYRLIETVIGLRKTQPDHRLPAKQWLRDAAHDLVPEFVFRRTKRGFTPPWRLWYSYLFQRFGEDLRSGVLVQHGILSPEAYRNVRGVGDGLGRPKPLLAHMFVLEAWAQGMQSLADSAKEKVLRE